MPHPTTCELVPGLGPGTAGAQKAPRYDRTSRASLSFPADGPITAFLDSTRSRCRRILKFICIRPIRCAISHKNTEVLSLHPRRRSRRSIRGEWQSYKRRPSTISAAPGGSYNSPREALHGHPRPHQDLAIKELSLVRAKLDPNAPLADLGRGSLTFSNSCSRSRRVRRQGSDDDLRKISVWPTWSVTSPRRCRPPARPEPQDPRWQPGRRVPERRVAVTGIGVSRRSQFA